MTAFVGGRLVGSIRRKAEGKVGRSKQAMYCFDKALDIA